MDVIDEQEYYRQLIEARDEYLTDDSNLDEYRKTTEDIYKYQSDMLDKTLDAYQQNLEDTAKALKEQVDAIQSQLDDVYKQQEEMSKRLGDYGDLYTVDKVNVPTARQRRADVQRHRRHHARRAMASAPRRAQR